MTTSLPVSERACIGALCLFLVVPTVVSGCRGEGRLPTAVAPSDDLKAAAPNVVARDERVPEIMRGHGREHPPAHALILEAKGALSAVLTGEQGYLQKWLTFTDVPDTADFRVVLGVYFPDDLLRRWAFSVSGASVTGFLATAEGCCDTGAEGITVTLSYQRGQPIVWAVQRRRHCR